MYVTTIKKKNHNPPPPPPTHTHTSSNPPFPHSHLLGGRLCSSCLVSGFWSHISNRLLDIFTWIFGRQLKFNMPESELMTSLPKPDLPAVIVFGVTDTSFIISQKSLSSSTPSPTSLTRCEFLVIALLKCLGRPGRVASPCDPLQHRL